MATVIVMDEVVKVVEPEQIILTVNRYQARLIRAMLSKLPLTYSVNHQVSRDVQDLRDALDKAGFHTMSYDLGLAGSLDFAS